MVNPPVCTSSSIKVIFLIIKNIYCFYPRIFKFTVLQKTIKKKENRILFFFKDVHLHLISPQSHEELNRKKNSSRG